MMPEKIQGRRGEATRRRVDFSPEVQAITVLVIANVRGKDKKQEN